MVSLIIVDYKSIPKTLEYISSCYMHIKDREKLHVIIVDNTENPEKGLEEISAITGSNPLEKKVKDINLKIYCGKLNQNEIIYVCTGNNLGYAGGNNVGSEVAKLLYDDPYYLFSNNDMRIKDDFRLQTLMNPMMVDRKRAAVGPKILGRDGTPHSPWKKSTAWMELFLNYFDLLLPKRMKITNKITSADFQNVSKDCYWVSGSFLLVDAQKFQQAGKFDPHTFLYSEEAILAERFAGCGYHMYFENDVTLIHEHGQTVKSAMSVLKGIRYGFESSLYYYETYRHLRKIWVVLARIHFAFFAILFYIKNKMKRIENDADI